MRGTRRSSGFLATVAIVAVASVWGLVHSPRVLADALYFDLSGGNFSQDWSNVGLITADDNWSGVPSIVGFRGDGLTGSTGTNPQSIVGTSTVVDVIANQANPNTLITGGVAEFQLADPVVALQGPARRGLLISSCT
jgi:hypothetical protein